MYCSNVLLTLLIIACRAVVASAIAYPPEEVFSGSSSKAVSPTDSAAGTQRRDVAKSFPVTYGDGNAPADQSPIIGSGWFVNAKAGSNSEPVSIAIDTRGADFWLYSPKLVGSAAANAINGPYWDPDPSTKTEAQLWAPVGQGGSHSIQGPIYTDKFCLNDVCVSKMPIASIESGTNIKGFSRSGMLGLGFHTGSLATTQSNSFPELLEGQPFVTLDLQWWDAATSTITFGEPSPNSYIGQLQSTSIPTNSQHQLWQTSPNARWTSTSSNLGSSTTNVTFDTGCPGITAPNDIVNAYYTGIKGAQDVNGDQSLWTVPCKTELPPLSIKFDSGASIDIAGEYLYNFGPLDTSDGQCKIWFSAGDPVLGEPLFVANVVVVDRKGMTVGLGSKPT